MAFCSDHFWCAIQIAVLAFLRVEGKRSDVYFGEEDGDSTLKLNLHEFNCFFFAMRTTRIIYIANLSNITY